MNIRTDLTPADLTAKLARFWDVSAAKIRLMEKA
jgi:hypothetical protein